MVLFGARNGTAFVPLTGASLAGVRPEDAGAASGLVNVTTPETNSGTSPHPWGFARSELESPTR